MTYWNGSLAAAVCVTLLAGCGSDSLDGPQIRTLSNRADLVSDGDVLVELTLPEGSSLSTLKVDVNGRDVSSSFALRSGRVLGLVTGLAEGRNVISARTEGSSTGELVVTNAPRGGPILSGAQINPFYCATPTPQPANGNVPATNASGLSGQPVDAKCNIPTEFKLYYKTTAANCSFALPDPSPAVSPTATAAPAPATPPANPCFKPFDPAAAPADLATTTTDAGLTVPYIIRLERGTMNRGIYDVAVLYDATKPWTGAVPQAQWNRKILFQFGASTGQPRRQARPQLAWTNDAALSRGFMVVGNSMTDSAQNSNRVMMSETVMMMKEHIADTYGEVRHTIGTGCSGGSINSNMNASIAPGQLDGITISCAYPDSDTAGIEVGDCVLLVEAYQKPAWTSVTAGLTQAQINAKKAAINGHPDQTGCHGWFNAFGSNAKAGTYFMRTVPSANHATGAIAQSTTLTNNCQLPNSAVYDPVTNPGGPRCNTWSWSESIYGKVPGTAFARDTRDNIGVQYGLKALQSGAISAEEFVTLNEAVGGFDRDSNLTVARNAADREALDISYRSGIVLSGKQLAKTAVIDMRGWDDSALLRPPGNAAPPSTPIHFVWRSFAIRERPPGNAAPPSTPIHFVWRSFAIRERLDREFGNHDNQVLWRFGRNGLTPSAAMSLDSLLTMDKWLTAIKADTSSAPIEQKVRSAKPAEAFDYCLLSDDAAQATKVTDKARCDADAFLKPSASPRQVAGGPLAENVLKCQLKPLSFADYAPVSFTANQQSRLAALFPSGVCDWSKPGVGQQDAVSPLTFAAGPGGQPLPAAPVTTQR